jgi:polysaccharide pyruvyl transferase CsaB
MSHVAPPKILISGYYGFDNAGDEAILSVMLRQLRQSLGAADVTVVSGDPAATAASHGVTPVLWSDPLAIAEAVRRANLVIIGGGGLFHDYTGFIPDALLTTGNWGLGFHVTPALLAAIYGKPLILYAVGVGPLFSEHARKFTRAVCEAAQAISVRDQASRQILESIGVAPGRVTVTADPAFALRPAEPERIAEIMQAEGLANGCPLIGVVLRHWAFGSHPAFWEKEVAAGLDRFLDETSASIVFIPFQQIPGEQENDAAVVARVRSRMRLAERTSLLGGRYKPAELAGILGGCSLVVGMRLHALIFSVVAGVPCVSLRYDPKVSEAASQAGLSPWMIDLGELDADLLARRMRDALAGKPELKLLGRDLAVRAESNIGMVMEVLRRAGSETAPPLVPEVLDLLRVATLAQLRANHEHERQARSLEERLSEEIAGAAVRVDAKDKEQAALLAHIDELRRRISELEADCAARSVASRQMESETAGLRDRLERLTVSFEKTSAERYAALAFADGWHHRGLSAEEWRHDAARRLRLYQRDLKETLDVYRRERAWRGMLALRKAGSLLMKEGWMGRVEFIPWLLRALVGQPTGLEEFELDLPSLARDLLDEQNEQTTRKSATP